MTHENKIQPGCGQDATMTYRSFGRLSLSRLAFGTASFVSGKHNPEINSIKGMVALSMALEGGVNLIHSNFDLGTQWALKAVLNTPAKMSRVHHIVKIKVPTDAMLVAESVRNQVELNLKSLGIDHIDMIEHHFAEASTGSQQELNEAFAAAFDEMKISGKVGYTIGMIDRSNVARGALDCGYYDGFASYFNLIDVWPKELFEEINRNSLGYIGIRPLKFGALCDTALTREEDITAVKCFTNFLGNNETLQAMALRFVLSFDEVVTTVIGTSNPAHVKQNLCTMASSLDPEIRSKLLNCSRR